MDAYPLMILCNKIRARAKDESIFVSREIKSDAWKSKLLKMISDETVMKQLMFIHPFQFAEELSSPSWYVFRLPFFKYSVYVKLNAELTKVISFHYDELPQNPKKLNTLFIATDTARAQVIEDGTAADRYLPFALGSTLIKLYPQRIYRDADGTEFVDTDYLKRELDNPSIIQQNIISKLKEIYFDVDFANVLGKDLNFLSWVNEDEAIQTVSVLADVFHANPEIGWLQNACVDILLQNSSLQTAYQIYQGQLYPQLAQSEQAMIESEKEI